MKKASIVFNILGAFVAVYNLFTIGNNAELAQYKSMLSIYYIINIVGAVAFLIYLLAIGNKKPSVALSILDILFGSFLGGIFALGIKEEEAPVYVAPQKHVDEQPTRATAFVQEQLEEAAKENSKPTNVANTSGIDKDAKR